MRLLSLAPVATVALLLAPILAGLAGTALPAFGHLPAIGAAGFSLAPWAALLDWPGLPRALLATLVSGFGATLLSLLLAMGLAARLRRLWLPPLLAAPHAAMAIGLAFLIAPSGWLARLLAPLFGWQAPPDIATVQDPLGLALLLGLTLKETPYLLLMILAARANERPWAQLGAALGYGRMALWLKGVWPPLYAQVRLPVYAALAYGLSNVDMALVLGPTTPPTLAAQVVRWFSDPDLRFVLPGAAAALLQLAIVIGGIGVWRLGEKLGGLALRGWTWWGGRWRPLDAVPWAAPGLLVQGLAYLALALLLLWSVAGAWRFPDLAPASLDGARWLALGFAGPLANTLLLALLSAAVALLAVLLCLENEAAQRRRPGPAALWILYAPLLVPQVAFLFGAQTLLLRLDLDGSWLALVWAHLLFVLPYVFLSLADPWRAFDPRYARIAACLGASPWGIFWRVKLPILLRPVLAACAVGFAVSAGQYLATLFAGAGRFATLTTEAVTLAAGGDRRIVGLYATLQALAPMVVYLAAALAPLLLFRHRRGLRP